MLVEVLDFYEWKGRASEQQVLTCLSLPHTLPGTQLWGQSLVEQLSCNHEVRGTWIPSEEWWDGKIESTRYLMTFWGHYFTPWLPAQKFLCETNTSLLIHTSVCWDFCYGKQTQLNNNNYHYHHHHICSPTSVTTSSSQLRSLLTNWGAN